LERKKLRRRHLSGKQGVTRERKVPKVAVLRTADSSPDEKDQSGVRCRLFSFLERRGQKRRRRDRRECGASEKMFSLDTGVCDARMCNGVAIALSNQNESVEQIEEFGDARAYRSTKGQQP
jgi:hypothetical protein